MTLAGRSKETAYNIITMLTGRAWDLVEDLNIESLAETNGFDLIFVRLDAGFRYDPLTELPDDFENFFVKLPGITLQEYAADFTRTLWRLKTNRNVELPEKICAWWFIRCSGVTKEQRQMVLTMMGADKMNLTAAQEAVYFIVGQDSKADQPRWNRGGRDKDVLYGEDWDSYYQMDPTRAKSSATRASLRARRSDSMRTSTTTISPMSLRR